MKHFYLHISNGSYDIVSARKSNVQTELVKGNNFVINGSIIKKKKKYGSAYCSYRKYIKFQGSTQIGFQDTVGT